MIALGTLAGVALADAGPPRIVSAAAISQTEVRVRFSEPVVAGGVVAADFLLEMGGEGRVPTGVSVSQDGRSAVVLAATWAHGTAGTIGLRDGVPDAEGEQAAQPRDVRVLAAPGDFESPRITAVTLTPRTICLRGRGGGGGGGGDELEDEADSGRAAASCATTTRLRYTLSEPTRMTLSARRSGTRGVSKVSLPGRAGRNSMKIERRMRGLSLRQGRYTLGIGGRDASGNRARTRKIRLVVGQ